MGPRRRRRRAGPVTGPGHVDAGPREWPRGLAECHDQSSPCVMARRERRQMARERNGAYRGPLYCDGACDGGAREMPPAALASMLPGLQNSIRACGRDEGEEIRGTLIFSFPLHFPLHMDGHHYLTRGTNDRSSQYLNHGCRSSGHEPQFRATWSIQRVWLVSSRPATAVAARCRDCPV